MMKKSMTITPLIITVLIFLNCDLTEDSIEEGPKGQCSELAFNSSSQIALEEILCIAQDDNGIVYVVDKKEYNYRFFYSSSDTLIRRKVLGSSVMGEIQYSLSIENMPFDKIEFSNNNGIWGWVQLCQNGQQADCSDLTTLDPPDISQYSVMNFPATTHVEYLARLADSNHILVTRTYYDWDGTVIVHFGLPGQMEVRPVTSFLRATDGGSTWIRFMAGSEEVEAVFRVKLDTSGISQGPTYFVTHGDTLNLETLVPSQEALKTIGFDCNHEFR